jgi:hypothetical protein
MTLLGAGLATFVFSYAPAATVPIYSDHKGDQYLYIPFAGPWLDLANRGCAGPTVMTPNGPYELSSARTCGTSAVEEGALITAGIFQGLAALQIMGSFFIPENRAPRIEVGAMPRFAIVPTVGVNGIGAMARGRF